MMIHSLCQGCLQPYRLMISASEVELIKQIADETGHTAPCPRLCGGSINLVGDPAIDAITEGTRLRDPMSLTGKELYRAVNGAGLPDELPKDSHAILSLFKGSPIRPVLEMKDGKYYLAELHFDDSNMVMHLTAGLRGAEILKITRGG